MIICATVYDCVNRASAPAEIKEDSKELNEIKKKITGEGVVNEYEYVSVKKPPKKNPFISFVVNCSLYTNSERIFRTDNGGKYTCLNGLRALSMMWIIMGHTFNYLADYKLFFLLCK